MRRAMILLCLLAGSARADEPPAPERFAATLDGAVVDGPADALVTVVIFDELGSIWAQKVADVPRELRARYGNDLRLAWRFPLDTAAARAACAAAGQGELRSFTERVWATRTSDPAARFDEAAFDRLAADGGLDVARFRRDRKSAVCKRRVAADGEHARAFEIQGAPSFLINGRALTGARPLAEITALVDSELAAAKAAVAAGTKRERYYQERVLDVGVRYTAAELLARRDRRFARAFESRIAACLESRCAKQPALGCSAAGGTIEVELLLGPRQPAVIAAVGPGAACATSAMTMVEPEGKGALRLSYDVRPAASGKGREVVAGPVTRLPRAPKRLLELERRRVAAQKKCLQVKPTEYDHEDEDGRPREPFRIDLTFVGGRFVVGGMRSARVHTCVEETGLVKPGDGVVTWAISGYVPVAWFDPDAPPPPPLPDEEDP